jgi:hypothetical protein
MPIIRQQGDKSGQFSSKPAMEINANMNIGSIKGMTPTRQSTPAPKSAGEETSFAGSVALDGALSKVPDVRTDAVARARDLINDPSYPSAEVVKKLSNFFAAKLTAPQD